MARVKNGHERGRGARFKISLSRSMLHLQEIIPNASGPALNYLMEPTSTDNRHPRTALPAALGTAGRGRWGVRGVLTGRQASLVLLYTLPMHTPSWTPVTVSLSQPRTVRTSEW
jgi:hypothetical protein